MWSDRGDSVVEDDDVCWMCGLPSDSSDSYSNDVCDCYDEDED